MRCRLRWFSIWGMAIGLLLSACANLQPTGNDSAYNRGMSAFAAGAYGLAAEALSEAVNQNPGSVSALNALGATYDRIGRFDLAQRQYRKALALDPASTQTLNNIGYSYLLQGRPDVAIVYLRDASRHADPANSETLSANLQAAELALAPPPDQATATAEPTSEPATPQIRRMTGRVQAMRTSPPEAPIVAPLDVETAPHVADIETPRQTPEIEAARRTSEVEPTPRMAEVEAVPLAPEIDATPHVAKIETEPRSAKTGAATPAPEVVAPQVTKSKAPVLPQPPGVRPSRPGAAADAIPHPVPVSRPAADTPVRLEISNGADRLHMAERMRDHLQDQGWAVARLSEAAHHAYGTSTIYYRSGHAAAAEALREALAHAAPQLAIEQHDKQGTALSLRLGNDLLAFDQHLYAEASGGTTHLAKTSTIPETKAGHERRVAQASLPQTRGAKGRQNPRTARIEVANGTGRSNMAARMSDHLSETGIKVSWITNAATFDHQTSSITYRSGARAAATSLREALPAGIEVKRNTAQRADVKLTLGADLIGFDQQLAAKQTPPVIEVSNGAGRNRMAARMRAYLTSNGLTVGRITNADHFEHETTTIFYRVGLRAQAQKLAAILPIKIQLRESSALATDLRLELGRDLLSFDTAQAKPAQPAQPG